jgi:hypothetical protein
MKFTMQELLSCGSEKFEAESLKKNEPVIYRNAEIFLIKLNYLGQRYKQAVKATSFLRSLAGQKLINPQALNSSHLYGRAVDLADEKNELKKWLKNEHTITCLIEFGFWVEDFKATPTWVHLQDVMPASGNRFFKP